MEIINKVVIIYFLVMNVVGFSSMGMDKKRAKNSEWRIKEKTLFFIAIIGGSFGSVLGMETFHHKTKHTSFVIGMRIILLLQIILVYIYSINLCN